MKIVIVGTAYPMRGGIAQYNSLLFKYLSHDNDVKIFSFKKQYPEFLFPGKTQYETSEPAYKIPEEKNIIAVNSVNPFNWFICAQKIRNENPDLLIFKYWLPFFAPCFFTIIFLVKLFRKTNALFICDNVIPHEKRFGDKFLTRLVFTVVDFFIVQSRAVENDLLRFNKKKKPHILTPHPLYNIFGESTGKEEAREVLSNEFSVNTVGDKVILFFGYIRKYKGLNYIIDAMPAILKKIKVKLLIVGEFYDDEKPYRDRIQKLGIGEDVNIISDFIPDDKVRYFFSACDCLVLPYIDATQSGIVQISYFYDKPVIATNVGGLAEVVINERTGLITEPEDSSAIADAVIRFYEENLEYSFVENIKTEKAKYSWETFTNNLYELIKI